jgi:hypothetical protein
VKNLYRGNHKILATRGNCKEERIMYISSKGIGVRYNDKIDLSAIKCACKNWGLTFNIESKQDCVYFYPKNPEKPIEDVIITVRDMVRHLDGLEWLKL